ncbi:hypothetical protein SPHINGO8BC_80138 [Sphingobacterium multivorum]|uniref:Uncharacterized protein n=1 Tax=Sphingobacterium multivorum TaxID=28454 RepID=A0A654DPG1_SPHMU|nr:hypothetical protein SPHINGO8BC_80138 [Sphingobacterium multivorum]
MKTGIRYTLVLGYIRYFVYLDKLLSEFGIIPKVWGVKFLSIQFHYSI